MCNEFFNNHQKKQVQNPTTLKLRDKSNFIMDKTTESRPNRDFNKICQNYSGITPSLATTNIGASMNRHQVKD